MVLPNTWQRPTQSVKNHCKSQYCISANTIFNEINNYYLHISCGNFGSFPLCFGAEGLLEAFHLQNVNTLILSETTHYMSLAYTHNTIHYTVIQWFLCSLPGQSRDKFLIFMEQQSDGDISGFPSKCKMNKVDQTLR